MNNQKSIDIIFEDWYNQNIKFREIEFSGRSDASLKQLIGVAYKFGILQWMTMTKWQ